MTAWIALVLSTITLIVNIIVQREKLLSFLEESRERRAQQKEQRKALESISKFSASEVVQPARKGTPVSLFLSIFLIGIISSVIAGALDYEASFFNTFLISGTVYFAVAVLTGLVFLTNYHRFELRNGMAILVGAAALGYNWGLAAGLAELLGLRMILSGILASAVFSLYLWLYARYTNPAVPERRASQ